MSDSRAAITRVLDGQSSWTVEQGDSLELLRLLPDQSVDAVVTDPPAGIAFMGRAWDKLDSHQPVTDRGKAAQAALAPLLARWEVGFVTFLVDMWVETLRVVKPGGYMLHWALPRTADLSGVAIRLAGWEIRDSLVHLFGQGFPKSLDVSKALDKMHGTEREVVGVRLSEGGRTGTSLADGRSRDMTEAGREIPVTAPATDDAKRWQGWGTALSPGHEQWILARAPLASTVARNVLAHGCGAINVDGCRTATSDGSPSPSVQRRAVARRTGHVPNMNDSNDDGKLERGGDGSTYMQDKPGEQIGRWPKNALLSCSLACEDNRHSPGCPVAEMDSQSGILTSGNRKAGEYGDSYEAKWGAGFKPELRGDSGGASRFFPSFTPDQLDHRFRYEPKASDRRVPGAGPKGNKHPTHKPVELMRWMVRLVTPTAAQAGRPGVVLDPFNGSGTTGVAAQLEACGTSDSSARPSTWRSAGRVSRRPSETRGTT